MVPNQKIPERKKFCHRAYTIMVLNPKYQKLKEKLVTENTLKRGFLKTTPGYGNKDINGKKQLHTQNCY